MPAKLIYSPNSKHSAAVAAVPVNECITPLSGPRRPSLAQHRQHIGIAFPRVHHEGQVAFLGQPQMAIEIILLNVERTVVPVTIQTGFADRHDFRRVDKCNNSLPIAWLCLGAVVGLNADRRKNRRMIRRQSNRRGAGIGRNADSDDLLHARRHGSSDHIGPIGVELFLIQMRMGIDKHGNANDRLSSCVCRQQLFQRFQMPLGVAQHFFGQRAAFRIAAKSATHRWMAAISCF